MAEAPNMALANDHASQAYASREARTTHQEYKVSSLADQTLEGTALRRKDQSQQTSALLPVVVHSQV